MKKVKTQRLSSGSPKYTPGKKVVLIGILNWIGYHMGMMFNLIKSDFNGDTKKIYGFINQ